MADTKTITLLNKYAGKAKSKPKHLQTPSTIVSLVCVVPANFPKNGEKMLLRKVKPFVDTELKAIHDGVSDLDKIMAKTDKQIRVLNKKSDASSQKKLATLQKEQDAQDRAVLLLNKMVATKRKDIEAKSRTIVEEQFETWKKEDKQRRNHKIKLAAKITLSSVAVVGTTLATVALTGAGAAVSAASMGAAIPIALTAAAGGVSMIATSIGGLIKVALNAKNSLKSEGDQRRRLRDSVDKLKREIYHQQEQELKKAASAMKERGKLGKLKHKILSKKDQVMAGVRALKGEGTKVEGIMKDHRIALTKIRQNAIQLGRKRDALATEIKTTRKAITSAAKSKGVSKETLASSEALIKQLEYLQAKLKHVDAVIKDKEHRVDVGEKLHSSIKTALAAWKKGNAQSFDKLAPIFNRFEKYAPIAKTALEELVNLGTASAKVTKDALKLAA